MNNVLLHFIISINCYKIPSFSCVSFPTFRSSTHDNVILQGFFFVFSEWFANCCFCGAHETSVWFSDYIQIEVTAFFRPTKKKRNGFFCVNLHRSSFRGASLVLPRVLTGGAASCCGLHPPWSQPAQEASLSSLHPSWKLLLISKCHKFHSPLSLGALAKGGEHRGGEKGKEMMHSFFLSFSLSSEEKAWCWHSSQSAASQIPFPIWSVGAQHETAPAAGTSKLLIFQRVHHFADVWWNACSFSRHSLWFYLLSVAHPNSHYILLLCHPYANKRNCCSSEL